MEEMNFDLDFRHCAEEMLEDAKHMQLVIKYQAAAWVLVDKLAEELEQFIPDKDDYFTATILKHRMRKLAEDLEDVETYTARHDGITAGMAEDRASYLIDDIADMIAIIMGCIYNKQIAEKK